MPPGKEDNMKFIEINKGDPLTINGKLFILEDIEKDTAVLRDVGLDKLFCYGLAAFQIIAHQYGYTIIEKEF